jgi:cobalt-precorrin 5A hydrolase/precorrin-3B C17-methyltransferase
MTPNSPPAIISFVPAARGLAQRLADLTQGEVMSCGTTGTHDARTLLPRLFAQGRPIIGLCAAGILIRLLAPHLGDKQAEPPVLAVAADGASIVPLLGGHHGANELARHLAEALGAHAAVTTASDSQFSRGLDEPPAGWTLADPRSAKPAMMAVLSGARLALDGFAPWLADAGYPISYSGAVRVLVTEQRLTVDRGLVYHPRTLVAGVGCERGTPAAEIIDLVDFALKSQNLSPHSLACLATVALKADETGILEAARHYGVPLRLFSVDELNQERYRLEQPSAVVEAEIGTPSVAEAAALKAGVLTVKKLKGKRVTCAIGKAPRPLDLDGFGRSPGRLHLVGLGPGDAASRTAAAVAALADATDWVGYGLYLDLAADLHQGQAEHRFPLGDEELRVRHALELAGQGRAVALLCSGDAQIYAMAALVYELLDAEGPRAVTDNARRVTVLTHPGVSAFQAASAAAGALIGHDFCAISLSDLLTPREDIEKRLRAAAAGDFVTAFYNPRSQRRIDLIETAKSVYLAHRPPTTPVIIARSLGRPEQQVEVTTLADFDPAAIDMLTIVLFGASTSRAFTRGSGHTVTFTPRGYAKKELK